MDPANEKVEALGNAEKLLERGGSDDLRYATLELRRCIEAIVYQKLLAYKARLPNVALKWQPPQAFKALIQLEPEAAHTTTYSFGWQPQGPFHAVGVDRRPSTRWLSITYNKLGSRLHAAYPFEKPKPPLTAEYLAEVLAEARLLVEARITASFADLVTVACQFCGADIVRVCQKITA